ncbi:MAG: SDR family oxidoreductase [Labilithrix sp.]|nr:SDR family oxidoreductase [Labilithrix sp.]
MKGRTVVITGASSGIGLETARALAQRGARVVMVVRSKERGQAAIDSIKSTQADAELELVLADLYSLAEVRAAAAKIKERLGGLHVLVNNAGLIHKSREETIDGLERTFALNHLSAWLLTYELRELLAASAPARVVTVASAGHMLARADWDDMPYCKKGYGETRVYGDSKLCNILFARESAKRFEGKGVTSNSLHPGAVASNFGASGSALFSLGAKLVRPFLLTSAQGARTSIHLASAPDVEDVSGAYFVKSAVAKPSRAARNDENAKRLWSISEELCGVTWS